MGAKARTTAGYSKTPLAKKLGIREGFRVAVVAGPPGFASLLDPLPSGVAIAHRLSDADDVRVFFTSARSHLESELPRMAQDLGRGGLWIAWPKRASKVATDVTEDGVREIALALGLVDVKVCAIDETWSGLRLYWRKTTPS